jgi:hypothetical protein
MEPEAKTPRKGVNLDNAKKWDKKVQAVLFSKKKNFMNKLHCNQ